ncbi:MAG TPA: hypothetical protein VM848_13820 [Acidimicrobiia bacterium]|nr:hypothetical protein [Acidimicrobiia bacterium]
MEPNAVEAVLLIMHDLMEEGLIRPGRATRSLVLQRLHQEWSFGRGEGRDAWEDALASGLIMEVGHGRRPALTGEGEAAAINLRNSVLREHAS